MTSLPGDPVTAWAPYRPGGDRPWNLKWAGHLLRRAGFGGSWGELQQALSDGPARTLQRLLRPQADLVAFNREADGFESDGQNVKALEELRGSWLRRMIATPDPLREKMTLFWHGWFGVSAVRQSAALALAHVRMLRAHAVGRFDDLLSVAVRDPAVILAAGGKDNYKARPNLPLAQQMLAGYTVGEGQFRERDATETARAFAGLFVRGDQLRETPHERDEGEKTILGQTGRWTETDFARIAAGHPALAQRVVAELYRWWIGEEGEPSADLLAPLVRSFAADRDIGKLAGTMLGSNLFYSDAAYRCRVKSPVELAAGLCRAFESQVPALRLGGDVADLGQELYHPPTVAGWAGGRAWINPASLARRARFAELLFAGSGAYENRLAPAALAKKYGRPEGAASANFLGELLVQGDVPPGLQQLLSAAVANVDGLRRTATLIAACPEYQLA